MSCESINLAGVAPANEQRRLVAAAKQRDQDQHRNRDAEEPQQHISHSASLLVGPVGTQSCETLFHDVCPLVMELLCTRRVHRRACTAYRSVGSRTKSAGF